MGGLEHNDDGKVVSCVIFADNRVDDEVICFIRSESFSGDQFHYYWKPFDHMTNIRQKHSKISQYFGGTFFFITLGWTEIELKFLFQSYIIFGEHTLTLSIIMFDRVEKCVRIYKTPPSCIENENEWKWEIGVICYTRFTLCFFALYNQWQIFQGLIRLRHDHSVLVLCWANTNPINLMIKAVCVFTEGGFVNIFWIACCGFL